MNEHVRHIEAAPKLAPDESPQTRRVVFLGTSHDNGGSSVLAGNLAQAMRAQGYDVDEWYLFASSADPKHARIFSRAGRSRSPLQLAKLFWRVMRELRARKPDVVIGLQPLSNLVVGAAGRLAGIPKRIATLHNPAGEFRPVLMRLDRAFGNLGFYTQVVACSSSVAETFQSNGHRYCERLAVIRNGHAAPALIERREARAELGLPVDGVLLGQIGRISAQKNQDFSVSLLTDIPAAQLLLVGGGPDAPAVKAAIAGSGLVNRAHLRPAIDHSRIGSFYSAVDLVLFPSRFEGLSLAAIEAVHAGVPLLCSDIPSFRELFAGHSLLTSTLLLPLSDRQAWLNRIQTLLDDGALRQQIVGELKTLSPAYTFDRMAHDYVRLIEAA
jgi:glycosyltransferase involved in cell wall biosynthesis